MFHFFYQAPASALIKEIDGNTYAAVPVEFNPSRLQFLQCEPRMLRATGCDVVDGVALVSLGRMGDKIAPINRLPSGVVCQYFPDPICIR